MTEPTHTPESAETAVLAPHMRPRLTAEQLLAAERIREYWAGRSTSVMTPSNPVPGGMESDIAASR